MYLYTTWETLPPVLVAEVRWLTPSTVLTLTASDLPTLRVVPKPELEDWRRVLTTSRGQVTMAPEVPATLKKYFNTG